MVKFKKGCMQGKMKFGKGYNFTLDLLPFHGNTERWKQTRIGFNDPEKTVYSFCRD